MPSNPYENNPYLANPFVGLDTPENLYLQREAENQKLYGDDINVYRAARWGNKFRKALNDAGIAMGREDELAISQHAIIQGAQEHIQQAVENGDIEPEEAQMALVIQTMDAFRKAGNYEAAAQLKPAYDAMVMQEQERLKLRAQAENEYQSGRYNKARADQTILETPSRIDAQVALAEQRRRAKAGKEVGSLQAWMEGFRKGDMTGLIEPNWKENGYNNADMAKERAFMEASANTFDRLGQLSTLIYNNPGVTSNAAGFLDAVQGEFKGTSWLALDRRGIREGDEGDADLAESLEVEARNQGKINKMADSVAKQTGATGEKLTAARARYESLIYDLAYTLAKARDPGGRLSDADVENALKILGRSGDPVAMRKVLNDVARDSYNAGQVKIKASPYLQTSAGAQGARDVFEEAWANFNKSMQDITDANKPKPKTGKGTGGRAPSPGVMRPDENGMYPELTSPSGGKVQGQRIG